MFFSYRIIKCYFLSTVKIHFSNQDLLARKLILFLFLEENRCCGYSLEAPYEYPQLMFSMKNKKKYVYHNLATLLIFIGMKSLSQD